MRSTTSGARTVTRRLFDYTVDERGDPARAESGFSVRCVDRLVSIGDDLTPIFLCPLYLLFLI